MTRLAIEDIQDFITTEIRDYEIEYNFEIEDDLMEVEFAGSFLKENTVSFSFRWSSGNVEFYSACESYIDAETRQFWIEFMSRMYGES